jgi:hypothetical protein
MAYFTGEGEYYINKKYGIKIWYPRDWQVSDRNTNPEVFKILLAITPPVAGDLICVLGYGEDWMNLKAQIMLFILKFRDNLRGSSVEDLVRLMERSIRQNPLPGGYRRIEDPTVIVINGEKYVRYAVTGITQGVKLTNTYYSFLEGLKFCTVACSTEPEKIDIYEPVFEKIVSSIVIDSEEDWETRKKNASKSAIIMTIAIITGLIIRKIFAMK